MNVGPEKPAKAEPPVLDNALSSGFNFYKGRWEGAVFAEQAGEALECLRANGLAAGLYEAEDETWDRAIKVKIPYYKIFIRHKNGGYYTWFRPSKIDEWKVPSDFSLATWYEFRA